MDRQPWCVGSGRVVGPAHNIGGRISGCPSCGRADLQVNRDGTLRYHVAMLMDELPRSTGKPRTPQRPAAPALPIFR